MFLYLLIIAIFSYSSFADSVYLDKQEINITANFKGSVLNLYGIHNMDGDIIIIMRGEKETYFVRKKGYRYGIWMNRNKKQFDGVYRYYSIYSQKSLDAMKIPHLLKVFEIGVDNINTYSESVFEAIQIFEYKHALFRSKFQNALFNENYNAQIVTPEKLIYAQIPIPNSIPAGNYIVSVYNIHNANITSVINIPVYIRQVGLISFIKMISRQEKFVYASLSILLSIGMAISSYIILNIKYQNVLEWFGRMMGLCYRIGKKSPKKLPTKPQAASQVTARKRGRPKKKIDM